MDIQKLMNAFSDSSLRERSNMKSTNEILKRIREVCGLEKLEFGCEVCADDNVLHFVLGQEANSKAIYTVVHHKDFAKLHKYRLTPSKFEIIGLPVELNHLLMAIPKTAEFSVGIDGGFMVLIIDGHLNEYKLDLTVEQNLNQNDELRAFISELIFK